MSFSGLFQTQGMLFLTMLIGYIFGKKGLADDNGKSLLTDLVLFVTLPASILKSFQIEFNHQIPVSYTHLEKGKEADFSASDIRYVSQPDFVGTEFHISGKYDMEVRLGIPGLFNVVNALAAVSVCSFLDLDKEKISHALEHIRVNGRMEIVYTSERCTVLVDYAHNAVSMESLLSTLRDYKPKRLVCVFGCGGNRSKDRRYSMGEIGGKLADLSIITADNSRYEKVEDIIADIRGSIEKTGGSFIEIPDRREAIRYSIPVSYTHLDVYKRQSLTVCWSWEERM